MIRNKPYEREDGGIVYLVTTPIGNLKDITLRALDILKEADIIACEDTRNTAFLLNSYDIKNKRLVSLYAQTELKNAKRLVEEVKAKKLKMAYCSDAGMPGISDPGSLLVQCCYSEGVKVSIIPGPTASLSALVLSGFDTADFTFIGFLPTKVGMIKKQLESLKNRSETLIFYESPKRVKKNLSYMRDVFGDDREVSLIRELTKIHEETIKGTLKELASIEEEIRGECVIIVKGNDVREEIDDESIKAMFKKGIKEKKSFSSLVKEIQEATGLNKNYIYKLGLEVKK